jgi:hypothetical protein
LDGWSLKAEFVVLTLRTTLVRPGIGGWAFGGEVSCRRSSWRRRKGIRDDGQLTTTSAALWVVGMSTIGIVQVVLVEEVNSAGRDSQRFV